MENKPDTKTDSCNCSYPGANRKILARCAYVFKAVCWIAIVYSVAIVAFNWIIMLRSQSPDMSMMIKTGIVSTIYQLVVGAIAASIFLWAEQITWLQLEKADSK